MVAERAGECFVRAVVGVQRYAEDIGCAVRESTRRLAEAPGTHIAHDRQPRRSGERPHQVKARNSTDRRDLLEGQLAGKMAFDIPERLLGRIHGRWPSFRSASIMIALRPLHLTVLALVRFCETGTGRRRSRLLPSLRKISSQGIAGKNSKRPHQARSSAICTSVI